MASHSENTKRIAKNTLMLYVRMLFSMVVSLYTSRVVLRTLGVEDYGIYNVVGGFVAMFSLISSSLSSATGRFLTFELGKGDMQRLKAIFSTSLLIHIGLALLVFLAAEIIGVWFLNYRMTIPIDRLYAANCVFQASIFSFMLGLFSTSYISCIVSHERMSAFAFIGIFEVVLRLCIILFVAYFPWRIDRLITFSLLLMLSGIMINYIYLRYCRQHFEECRFNIRFDRSCWKEMSAFAGWNFIGCTAGLLKDQGVSVLLNLFMGPILNAARGIASSVSGAVSSFAGNFMGALSPQITKSYATGDCQYTFSLVERGSRFSFYIMFILALPLLLETEFVLRLWLGEYPAHTVNFVRLVLLLSLSDVLSNTLITLQTATGKIRNYQLAVGGMLLMNFPFSYICLKLGFAPESTLIVAIVVSICCMLLRLWFLRKMAGLSMRRFMWYVYGNVLLVASVSSILPLWMYYTFSSGWVRFLSLTVVSVCCSAGGAYFLGCTKNERRFIQSKMVTVKQRFFK